MLDHTNLVVISTTLPNHPIAEKRRSNLVRSFSIYRIPLVLDYGLTNMDAVDIMYQIIVNKLLLAKRLRLPYTLICDDDFFPIPNFLEELNKSIAVLPSNWRTLHLCPGYLWGKKKQDPITGLPQKLGELNPEGPLNGMEYDSTGRVFINCTNQVLYYKGIWLGTPIAFVIQYDAIDSLLETFMSTYTQIRVNNDVILSLSYGPNDYLCRSPVLGYEREEGTSLFGSGGIGMSPGHEVTPGQEICFH